MRIRLITLALALFALTLAVTPLALASDRAPRGPEGPKHSLRPPAVRFTPNHRRLAQNRRRLADVILPLTLTDPTYCGSQTMTSTMPNITESGALWLLWWPQFKSHVVVASSSYSGTPYAGGPTFAEYLPTGQRAWQDTSGTWHWLGLTATVWIAPTLNQNVSYGIDDWYMFVNADGSNTGWIDNGLRLFGYSGPNASGGLTATTDPNYPLLPSSQGSFGCIY